MTPIRTRSFAPCHPYSGLAAIAATVAAEIFRNSRLFSMLAPSYL
jgi:hypothetical protein